MLQMLTKKISAIQLLSRKCSEEGAQTRQLGRHSSKVQRYDSRQNTITSSYASHSPLPIASRSCSQSAEELRAVCATLTHELLSIATKSQLQELLVVLPKIALWWMRNLSDHREMVPVFVTLLQEALEMTADHTDSLLKELPFQTCASIFLLSAFGTGYNESLYNTAGGDRKGFLTYFTMSPETLYGQLIQERRIFVNLHDVMLKQSISDLKSCTASLRSRERKRDVKAHVKTYISLHPKVFTATVEFSLDGLFLLDRRGKHRESSYEISLNAFLEELLFRSSSTTLSLLSIYPCRNVSRLIRAILYLFTRHTITQNLFIMQELLKIAHTVLRGIEASSLLPLLRCVRYFHTWLADAPKVSADKLKANCFLLLISLGDEAGRRVEEIPHDHRKGIIATFQSLQNTSVIASCDALDRVLSSLTQW